MKEARCIEKFWVDLKMEVVDMELLERQSRYETKANERRKGMMSLVRDCLEMV